MVTYAELKKHDYGTREARFGVDSQLPFGYCALTLAPVVEPVVTPSGHLYSREAMFEHMLTKTQELKKMQAAYDAQEAEKAVAHQEKVTAASGKALTSFVSTQLVLHSSSSVSSSLSVKAPRPAVAGGSINIGSGASEAGAKRKAGGGADEDGQLAAARSQLSASVGDRETLETLKSTSYWLPGFTPEHIKEVLPPPPKRPPSPNTGQQLRLKDLTPIVLKVDPDTAGLQEKKYQCAVTGKQITFQEVVLLKKANSVILESAYQDFCVKQGMQCPLTGAKLRPDKDVLKLVKSGSSFSAAGSVKASKYGHTIT